MMMNCMQKQKDFLPVLNENAEQRALIKWILLQPTIRDVVLHIPNEGKRTLGGGRNMRLLGLRRGVSDIFIAYPSGKYHGLWIEVKRKQGGIVSLDQKAWIDRMNSLDYAAHVCYGWEDGVNLINSYLSD